PARCGDGTVTIDLILPLLGVPPPLRAPGQLAVADGKRVVFVAETVEAPRGPLLGPGKSLVERQLNPLIDMEEMGVPVRLTEVQVSKGHILIRGAADLPARAP